jgi:hypothetical protein
MSAWIFAPDHCGAVRHADGARWRHGAECVGCGAEGYEHADPQAEAEAVSLGLGELPEVSGCAICGAPVCDDCVLGADRCPECYDAERGAR